MCFCCYDHDHILQHHVFGAGLRGDADLVQKQVYVTTIRTGPDDSAEQHFRIKNGRTKPWTCVLQFQNRYVPNKQMVVLAGNRKTDSNSTTKTIAERH